jgi:3-methyladenine DNA glycosylase AlkD
MTGDQYIESLMPLADPDFAEGLKRFGIPNRQALGLRMPQIRSAAKPFKGNKRLAQELYRLPIHEAKLSAAFIDDPQKLLLDDAEVYWQEFYSWDLVDQFCNNLFVKCDFALQLPFLWTVASEEYQRRAGIVMIMSIALHHKKMPDSEIAQFYPILKDYIFDERNFVRKAISWALRTIGKRSLFLNMEIQKLIENEWMEKNGKFKYWAAGDAYREITHETYLARLRAKEAKGNLI